MSVIGKLFEGRATKFTGGSPQTPQYWVKKLFGGGAEDTLAGIEIDEDKALTYSAVWNAVNIISGAVGFLPFVVYERLENGGKERLPESPVYFLLHDRPNPYMDALTFRETLQGHVLTWGNGYAEIERDGAARPLNLWPLPPNRVEPKVKDGIVYYEYTAVEGKLRPIAYDNMLHIKGLGFDGLKGYSVITYARESIAGAMATERFGAAFFGSGAQPGGVLQHPGTLSDQAHKHLKDDWEEKHRGVEQAHRIAILEEGIKYEKIGIPPEDSQFLESRRFSVTEIARWFDIPPHMLKEMSRATFSNIEHQGIEFVTWTLMKWLRRWEHESNWKLFGTQTYGRQFAEFVTAALLRGDTKSRYEAYQVAINSGWMARNEARILENLNPRDGLDNFLEPLNMISIGASNKPVAGDSQETKTDEEVEDDEEAENGRGAYRALFYDTWRRVITREVRALITAAEKREDFEAYLPEFYRLHGEFVTDIVLPVLRSYEGNGQDIEKIVGRYISDSLAQIQTALLERNGRSLLETITPLLDEWRNHKALEMSERSLAGGI